ncbi:helix-turn-helix transcriptional regulator [Pelagibacterium flavum]|uniref:Helix-turn-helix transcriptional regulator n=1 Tax=Pelagibacterium flavum TaxID=2984530 RepID=A0ABY6IP92_9HYPH|nr:helix-turn-helix domain-containing protein [Pelagibacterium sp. YIM 151497]UYQ71040.1 helix-turn-helix transcriptional regulator [Pelagibacterium sp. YIM 151497]
MNDHETQRIVTIQMGSQANDTPRTARHPTECLAEDWLAFLGHRWNALILWHLANGPMRYGELRDALPGITPKVLSERLAGLTGRLLILRTVSNGFPRETSYQLTPQGSTLGPIVLRLYDWAEENAARI